MYDLFNTGFMLFSAVFFVVILYALNRIINSDDNKLEWAHLISSRTIEGAQRASWNEIGKGLGVILCVWLPAVYVYSPKMDAGGLALVMGVALAYLGGVSGYAALLRSRQGGVETTKVTEIIPVSKVTETRTETQPIAREPGPN